MSNFRYYRPDGFPPIVKNLIIINVLVFVAQITLGNQFQLTERIMLYPILQEPLPEILPQIRNTLYAQGFGFEPYQIFTHMFAHSPTVFFHIMFNMFALWMFGRVLENVWGPKRFLMFYFLCGIGAAITHLTIQYFRSAELLDAIISNNPDWESYYGAAAPALGASGAVMGIFAAFAFLFPNTQLYLMFIPVPIKAKWMVLGLAAFDLLGGVSGGTGIAHFAHLGGALTGFIIVLIWNKTNKKQFY